jgi:ADP-heptose:LPS heptosyltransferase
MTSLKALRSALAWVPSLPPALIALRLLRRANAARDAKRWTAAAVLYEEALQIIPGHARAYKQLGHMLKESGDFEAAETRYLQAATLAPKDADLALQMGHFYKVAGRRTEAAEAYRRALALKPGWVEATEELARVGGSSRSDVGDDTWELAPELLPDDSLPAPRYYDSISIRRLGASRLRQKRGYHRVLRGIEAVRGYVVSAEPLAWIELHVRGAMVTREPLVPHRLGTHSRQAKFVFNLWHDFSTYEPGPAEIALMFTTERSRVRTHRAELTIVPLVWDEADEASDTIVPPRLDRSVSVDAHVRALPTMVRGAGRKPLVKPPQAILVQRADQLGDLVCSLPALRHLRKAFPSARIVLIATPANAALAETLDMIDEVIVAPFREEPSGRRVLALEDQRSLKARLSGYRFDIAIDLGEGSGSRSALVLSGAPFLYGFKDRESPWLSAGLELNGHDRGNYLEPNAHSRKLVALVDGLIALFRSENEVVRRSEIGRDLLTKYELDTRPYAVLHTGARLAYSRWPGFDALIELLMRQTDLVVAVMADTPQPHLIESDRLKVITGKLPFDQFDALISHASLFVGNDSGPKHLAALRGVRAISLHMARLNWNEWGQEISGSIISRRVPCAGCAISLQPEDCGKDFACLRDIRPEEVMSAAFDLLDKPSAAERAAANVPSRYQND